MVQRKVTNKLGIQADNLRHEKHLSNLKPSSFSSSLHHQDGKNRGPDLKKKMKKSRAIKLSDIESLKSPSMRKSLSQPGKPPPLKAPNTSTTSTTTTTATTTTTPQKQQPLIKTTIDGSPNYMKSTSCSDARKEQSQVSFRSFQSNSARRLSLSNSKASSGGSNNNNKPAKALAKSSSLKMVRTLTKSPSFKPSRASAKKSSRAVLCADMEAQRDTCSSTLKDSKFPPYLTLNPGGTEAEGTSVIKVCPYTYCSLNGHHHDPLPPLKCFLSARRRSIKTQKIMKLGSLSPRKGKPSNGGKEIENIKVSFDEKPVEDEEVGMDFFVEIYAKKKEDGGEEEAVVDVDYHEEQAFESLSDGSPKSEIDSDESVERYSSIVQTDGDNKGGEQEEERVGFEGFEVFSYVEMSDSSGSEATDMEWEEEQFSEAEVGDESNDSNNVDDESESKVGCFLEIESSDQHEACAIMPRDVVLVHEVMEEEEEEASDGESSCPEEDLGDGCGEQEWRQVLVCSLYDQLSCTEDEIKEEETDLVHGLIDSTTTEEPYQDEEAADENRGPIPENVIPEVDSQLDEANVDCCGACEEATKMEEDQGKAKKSLVTRPDDSEEQADHTSLKPIDSTSSSVVDAMEVEDGRDSDKEETLLAVEASLDSDKKRAYSYARRKTEQDVPNASNNLKWTIGSKKLSQEFEEERGFNPRDPNFLPLVPDPEAEKVDLKHQMMDERKNSEEYLIDYALQQTLTKLGPARKKKVALLVEAFETVMPVPKYEPHIRHPSAAFSHARPIQACS